MFNKNELLLATLLSYAILIICIFALGDTTNNLLESLLYGLAFGNVIFMSNKLYHFHKEEKQGMR